MLLFLSSILEGVRNEHAMFLKEAWAREMALYLSRHPIGMSSTFGIFSIALTLFGNQCLVTRHESSEKHFVCFGHNSLIFG